MLRNPAPERTDGHAELAEDVGSTRRTASASCSPRVESIRDAGSRGAPRVVAPYHGAVRKWAAAGARPSVFFETHPSGRASPGCVRIPGDWRKRSPYTDPPKNQ